MMTREFSANKDFAIIQEIICHDKLKKEIISNYDYIKWLEGFTRQHTSFLDNEWLYTPEALTPSDAKSVEKLSYFVDEIISYANRAHMEIQYGKSDERYVSVIFIIINKCRYSCN